MAVASQIKQVLAVLKSSRGALRLYAAHSRWDETRAVYDEAVDTVTEIIHDLESRLSSVEYQEPQYKGNWARWRHGSMVKGNRIDQAWQGHGAKPAKGKIDQ